MNVYSKLSCDCHDLEMLALNFIGLEVRSKAPLPSPSGTSHDPFTYPSPYSLTD